LGSESDPCADKDCHRGRPYGTRYYAAFVLDPDGHNIEGVYKGE